MSPRATSLPRPSPELQAAQLDAPLRAGSGADLPRNALLQRRGTWAGPGQNQRIVGCRGRGRDGDPKCILAGRAATSRSTNRAGRDDPLSQRLFAQSSPRPCLCFCFCPSPISRPFFVSVSDAHVSAAASLGAPLQHGDPSLRQARRTAPRPFRRGLQASDGACCSCCAAAVVLVSVRGRGGRSGGGTCGGGSFYAHAPSLLRRRRSEQCDGNGG